MQKKTTSYDNVVTKKGRWTTRSSAGRPSTACSRLLSWQSGQLRGRGLRDRLEDQLTHLHRVDHIEDERQAEDDGRDVHAVVDDEGEVALGLIRGQAALEHDEPRDVDDAGDNPPPPRQQAEQHKHRHADHRAEQGDRPTHRLAALVA